MIHKAIYDPAYRKAIERLRRTRKHQKLTQDHVARCLGFSRTWLSRVECCTLKIDILHLIRLCQAVGLSASELMREIEKELP